MSETPNDVEALKHHRNELVKNALSVAEKMLDDAVKARQALLQEVKKFKQSVTTLKRTVVVAKDIENRELQLVHRASQDPNHRGYEYAQRVVEKVREFQEHLAHLEKEDSALSQLFTRLGTDYKKEIETLQMLIAAVKEHQKKVLSTDEMTALMNNVQELQAIIDAEIKDSTAAKQIQIANAEIDQKLTTITQEIQHFMDAL